MSVPPANPVNPRLLKKQRRRDESPPDPPPLPSASLPSRMDCDEIVATRNHVSYKDIVAGSHMTLQDSDFVDLDDDDIELLEDDITLGTVNGVPTIDFSDRVQYLALKSMDLTLVVKVLGRRIGYNTLHNRIYGIWKPSHPIKFIDIENDFFLVKFSDRSDYLKVLTEGPWTIFGHYLTVEQWSLDFQPSQASPSRLMAWIRLSGLPLTLYKRSFLETIGNQIGSVIKVNFQIDNGCRGRFARLALVSDSSPPQPEAPLPNPPAVHSVPDEAFGPWMIVERRKCNPGAAITVNQAPKDSMSITHLSNPIFESSEDPHVQSPNVRDPVPDSMVEPTIPPATHVSVADTTPSSYSHRQQLHAKSSSSGKCTGIPKKASSISVAPRKPTVSGVKVARHATSNPPSSGSRSQGNLHDNYSSSLPRVSILSRSSFGPPAVILDPARHQVVHHRDTEHPCILVSAITADSWNRNIFGSLSRRKNHVMARLLGAQRCLSKKRNAFLSQLESSLQLELEQILDQEEPLWKQKSRCDWVLFGDRNTSYFHKRATINQRINRISSLQLNTGEWCDDDAILHDEAVAYFLTLFSIDSVVQGNFPISGQFPQIPFVAMQRLGQLPSVDEIKDSLFSMAPLKSSGIDGLHAEFFQKHWSIVGPSICAMIQQVFSEGDIDPILNRTVLTLIPKNSSPSSFKDFRPISLCSVIYKPITKVVVRRLKLIMPSLITPNQSAFISGRSITDNIIIN
ncbi:hypothetical protein GQ457_01G012460 [Hibiscus cannabinus]